MSVNTHPFVCSCVQNRSLNLLLEKERLKVAKLQQTLSQQAAALQDKPASGGVSTPSLWPALRSITFQA